MSSLPSNKVTDEDTQRPNVCLEAMSNALYYLRCYVGDSATVCESAEPLSRRELFGKSEVNQLDVAIRP